MKLRCEWENKWREIEKLVRLIVCHEERIDCRWLEKSSLDDQNLRIRRKGKGKKKKVAKMYH